MRIVLCAPEAPLPPPNGLNLLLRHTLDALRRDHDVHLVACRGPDQMGEVAGADLVAPPTWDTPAVVGAVGAGLVRRRPWRSARTAGALRGPLRQAVARHRPDVVHVVSGRIAGVGDEVDHLPRLLTAIDAWHLNADAAAASASGARRLLLAAEARNVRRFERRRFGTFGAVAVITERDRDALLQVAPHLEVEVVPHGVAAGGEPATERSGHLLVMHGVLSYPPNVEAARRLVHQILPRVRAAVPAARVALVGRDPAPAVAELGAVAGVEVTGAVDDVRPWLEQAAVYVCPMRSGGGIKNKLLEALAAEAPCVTTSTGASGLAVVPGVHLLSAEDDAGLAAHVIELLTDPGRAQEIGRAGRELVIAEHDWGAVADVYGDLYDRLTARGDRGWQRASCS